MCDEAGGCRDFTGNFRRVCPTLNRARAFLESLLMFWILRRVRRQSDEKHKCRRKIFRFLLRGRGNARQSVP